MSALVVIAILIIIVVFAVLKGLYIDYEKGLEEKKNKQLKETALQYASFARDAMEKQDYDLAIQHSQTAISYNPHELYYSLLLNEAITSKAQFLYTQASEKAKEKNMREAYNLLSQACLLCPKNMEYKKAHGSVLGFGC